MFCNALTRSSSCDFLQSKSSFDTLVFETAVVHGKLVNVLASLWEDGEEEEEDENEYEDDVEEYDDEEKLEDTEESKEMSLSLFFRLITSLYLFVWVVTLFLSALLLAPLVKLSAFNLEEDRRFDEMGALNV